MMFSNKANKILSQSKISQKRFSLVALLNTHKTRTDNLRLVDVADEFIARKENRKGNLSTFTVQDLLPWSVGLYRLLFDFIVITCYCYCF